MLHFKFRSIDVANVRRLTLLLAAAALVLSTATAQADLGDQLFKLLPDDGAADARFGRSIAIGAATAIVGGTYSAYLFHTTTGRQIATLLPNDGAGDDAFGYAVAISGAVAIVGAPLGDDNGTDSGSAYLFDITTGQQIGKLLPDEGAADDFFGLSVAISGTAAVVGTPGDDESGPESGSAYIFNTTTGEQVAKLLPNDGVAGGHFGSSVAISGLTALVGAPLDDDMGKRSGSAYLFDATTGKELVKLLPEDGAAFDIFGVSVAISGTTVIVGAFRDDDKGNDSGSVYLFDAATGHQIAKLLPSDGDAGDWFGASVAIAGTAAIVGAYLDDDNGLNSGSAYVFETITGRQVAKLLPIDGTIWDKFGYSVAISGTTAIVGAEGDDDNGYESGSAYLFDAAVADDCTEDSDGRVTICHIPPGNPDNAHTIRVSVKAVPAHLAHGDHCGPCEEDGGLLMGRSGGDAGHDPCPTDLDNSGDVGAGDLAEFLGAWGPNPGHPADLDGDGEVGSFDLALLLGNWGPCE